MGNLPGVQKRPFWVKEWFVEMLTAIPAVGMAAISYVLNAEKLTKWWGWLLLVLGIIVVFGAAAKIAKGLDSEKAKKLTHTPDDLRGCLHVLIAAIRAERQIPDGQGAIRATLWRVVPRKGSPTELEQIVAYVGANGGEPGRRHSIRCGVIGRAVREAAAFPVHIDSLTEEEYRRALRQEFGYEKKEASEVDFSRKSLMAVPVFGGRNDKKVVGVVFIDSTEPNLFVDTVLDVVEAACDGITDFAEEHYRTGAA